MRSFLNHVVVFICKLTARLPFRALYILSDLFYFILYHVVRYRRKVVYENLTRSFPEKSEAEIREISKKYYHHLADLGLETLKYSRMTEQEITDRIKIHNTDILEEYYNQGKSIVLLAMHYNNWEWIGALQRYAKTEFTVVYNPMRSNKVFDDYLAKSRVTFGGRVVAIEHSFKLALTFNKSGKSQGIVLVADQTAPGNTQFWTTFLNQETAFFTGPMKIAVKTDQPVVLMHMQKVKRGYYEIFFYKLVDKPSEVDPDEILMRYIRKLEEIIQKEPQYWLWTHRRWKHKRPGNIPLK